MLADKGLDGLYSDRLAEQMRELAPYAMKDLRPILASAMKSIREMFPGKSAYAVKDAHINALRREIAPEVRAQHYRDLIYSVVEVHQGNLILGDNAVIFHVEGAKTFKAFCEKDDYIIGALLPVAANRLVIGAKEQYSPDPHHFRTVFAQCSHEFFVADVHSEENEVLINHIGRRSELISEQELNELVAAGFESFRI